MRAAGLRGHAARVPHARTSMAPQRSKRSQRVLLHTCLHLYLHSKHTRCQDELQPTHRSTCGRRRRPPPHPALLRCRQALRHRRHPLRRRRLQPRHAHLLCACAAQAWAARQAWRPACSQIGARRRATAPCSRGARAPPCRAPAPSETQCVHRTVLAWMAGRGRAWVGGGHTSWRSKKELGSRGVLQTRSRWTSPSDALQHAIGQAEERRPPCRDRKRDRSVGKTKGRYEAPSVVSVRRSHQAISGDKCARASDAIGRTIVLSSAFQATHRTRKSEAGAS